MSEKIRTSFGNIEMISSNQITSPSAISSGISNILYRTNDGIEPNENEFDLSINKDIGLDNDSHINSNDLMNLSQLSTTSNDSVVPTSITNPNINLSQNIKKGQASCRFPKLEECAHFHYERVQLGPLSVRLADDKSDILNTSIASQSLSGDIVSNLNMNNQTNRVIQSMNFWFIIKVLPSRSDAFFIKRSFENLQMFDEMLHRCVYDRKISLLKDLNLLELRDYDDIEYAVAKYLERFSKIASDSLTCGTILTWLQLDNKGRRLPLADTDTMRSINTPAVGAAYGVRRYVAQACDEISIEVGDMISVIDMPSPAESIWWRGKKSHLQKSIYEVGFFPQSCVATIGDKVPRHFPLPAPLVGQLDVSPTKPVLRKHGKLIAFFRSFILSRPSRRRLKQSGIYKERVFSCDLSEHLLNSVQEIPMVLKCCAEFIEENGIVDGIYRLSGITSNIQKLRRAFDEERIPDLTIPEIKQDIHAVSSLLKMYFRELPNPLCTYQLYDNFVDAIQSKSDPNERLRLMKETVLKLPPPHYRTLKYLAMHLGNISKHSANTGMTDKNLAIVWAPNLLRSPSIESGGVAALRGVGIQAVVTEYLIRNSDIIFDSNDDYNRSLTFDPKLDSLTDCESLLIEQREHDQSLSVIERPKSLGAGAKLISLEEAQERHSRIENCSVIDTINNKSMAINTPGNLNLIGSYIEVGGGPSSLPDKYHTVLPVPRSWQKRKTHSWKSLFSRNSNTRNSTSSATDKLNPSLPKQISADNDNQEINKETETIIDVKPLRSLSSHNRLQEKQKSVDLLDAKPTIEAFVRSNSVDSLRTGTGHSRSVSHDSYFDLLQSPTRGTNCSGSREFSELGLNFDREEPEMRIFSESESLVSSPKVYGNKENIPPPSRRILRARPEDFSSTTNSVNPSPKKQPRLNFLNPNDVTQSWVPNDSNIQTTQKADDPSCKRSKLEDQLSDIQYIDCNTPEHITANTLCTSAQVHNQPLSKNSSLSGDINEDNKEEKKTPQSTTFELVFDNKNTKSSHIITRYSYPIVQKMNSKDESGIICKRKESESPLKERFSYPGLANSNSLKNINQFRAELSEKTGIKIGRTSSHNITEEFLQPRPYYSVSSPKIPTINYNNIHKSTSNEILKDQRNEMETSKISAATSSSSPIQSPRYSLLVGDTSSENSSAVNTPIFEMDPLNRELLKEEYTNFDDYNLDNYNTKELCINERSFGTTQNLQFDKINKRNLNVAKKELTLDLDSNFGHESMRSNKTEVDDLTKRKKQQIASPNNSNLTHTSDTSQSITPSEFGYQYLNHPANAISSISTTTTDSSPILNSCENLVEHTFSNYQNDMLAATPTCPVGNLISPIRTPTTPTSTNPSTNPLKSTISITYKSPIKAKLSSPLLPKVITAKENSEDEMDKSHNKTLLETNFDENIVYEQVKFFKNSVSEINEILNNVNTFKEVDAGNVKQIEMDISPSHKEINSDSVLLDERRNSDSQEDILMSDDVDSLEMEQSLYENVELRKQPAVYENMDIKSQQVNDINECKLEVDSLECEAKIEELLEPPPLPPPQRSPSSFSVKQLATKFETSPVDVQPPFDFGYRGSKKVEQTQNNNPTKQLNKYSQHTRSLDENAFIREFGRQQYQQQKRSEDVTKSVQQIDETRKSFEFSTQLKPKTLNPPKRLPGVPFDCNKEKPSSKLKLDLEKVDELTTRNYREREIRITPTTENRICLIQQNNLLEDRNDESLISTNLSNSLKVLSGVKLDRDRIERIKEERRHQLHEKYRAESFKSKSKTELREFPKDEKPHSESLRIKSKSRGDVRQLHKEVDNTEVMNFSNRIRRTSDEKNHNNQDMTTTSKEQKQEKFDKITTEVKSNRIDKPIPIARNSISSTREKISMFESRSQNQ